MIYTDDFINLLITCEKQIIDPPTKDYKEDRGHMKKNFTMQSKDKDYSFLGFIRVNIKFQENFSVGLDYKPRDEKGSICLLRCNGPTGENNVFPHHITYHIHSANAHTINNGLRPESNIDNTDQYATLEEAIDFYLRYINLNHQDRINYFPPKSNQVDLFKT